MALYMGSLTGMHSTATLHNLYSTSQNKNGSYRNKLSLINGSSTTQYIGILPCQNMHNNYSDDFTYIVLSQVRMYVLKTYV